jgi:GT2 family glycosyltransferase
LPVSVVIPCHDQRRFHLLVAAVASVRAQSRAATEIVVVVDHNEAMHARVTRDLPGVTVLRNLYQRGVSGNRNTGAQHTTTPLIVFLDDDTLAEPDWLARLVEPFADPSVVGTGGAIRPAWAERPRWVPEEFLWAYGGSYAGQPTTTSEVRNVWSASMAVRRVVFEAVGGFRVGFGKVGDRSRPEDTELCLRMARAGGGRWLYVPGAVIAHRVEAERSTLGWFLSRCYHEGRGKIEMSRLHRRTGALGAEREWVRRLPVAVGRGIASTLRGRDRHGAARAAAVLAGVAAAGLGAAIEITTRTTTLRPVHQGVSE